MRLNVGKQMAFIADASGGQIPFTPGFLGRTVCGEQWWVLGGSSGGCFLAVGSSGWVPPLLLSSGGTALQLSRICRHLRHCLGRAGNTERAQASYRSQSISATFHHLSQDSVKPHAKWAVHMAVPGDVFPGGRRM